MTSKKTLLEFKEQGNTIHNGKYDYSAITEYKGNKYKLPIRCYIHGLFYQTPDKHLQGQGCPKCARNYHGDTNNFICKGRKTHKNFYSYDKAEYVNEDTELIITCPIHGDFKQTPHIHLQGKGCPECAKIKMSRKIPKNEIIERAKNVHNNKYSYEHLDFNTVLDYGWITCQIHGKFRQQIESHLQGYGCPECGKTLSKNEKEIYEYLCDLVGKDNVVSRDRTILGNKQELDIYLPKYKLVIEYNGARWHSEDFNKGKEYHLNKTKLCNAKDIRLIHIFDYDYIRYKEIILQKINNILGISRLDELTLSNDIEINEVDNTESSLFLQKYSIGNVTKCSINIGCYYKGELSVIASFKEIPEDKTYVMENYATDNRYCYDYIGNEIINYFKTRYLPKEIIAYTDRNWVNDKDDNYLTLIGFSFDSVIEPSWKIYDGKYKVWNCGYFKCKRI